jgi:hypothetical protein
MSILATMLVVLGAVAVLALAWGFRVVYLREGFARLIRRRKMNARISSMAQLIEAGNRIPVALTLERSQIFYESAALHAWLEIANLDEVEYDSEQGTGKNILRLRAHGQSLEFVLDLAAAREWAALLPPHRFGDASSPTPSGTLPAQLAPGRTW